LLRYSKGARSERELVNFFHGMKYSVVRAAGSGVNALSPDLIIAKNGRSFVLECKAWDKGSISVPIDKVETLLEWERNGNMEAYIAWRMSNVGWFLIKPDKMKKTGKNYTVTRDMIKKEGLTIESFVNMAQM